MSLTHLSLFSGIGGLDLAAEWAGFTTVGQCEYADYPTKVLEKHWPDVPRWRDIRTLTKESFYERTGLRTVDIISGGFPCQPFSTAGKQRGEKDDRYLWPEMLRIVQHIQPTWVFGENVPGIIGMALDQVLLELANQGYEAVPFVVPASGVGAHHKRDRVFIVAHSECSRLQINRKKLGNNRLSPSTALEHDCFKGALQQDNRVWPSESQFCRVVNGVPNWMDRLKCLGNAVVPQQAYPIFKAIVELESAI